MSDLTGKRQTSSNVPAPERGAGFATGQPGIQAIHVNSAREMVRLHTQGRQQPFQSPSRGASLNKTIASTFIASSSSRAPPISSAVKPARQGPSISVPAKTTIKSPDCHTSTECKNPQCTHCGLVIIPSPKSSYPIQDVPSITVNDWSVFVFKKPILNAQELDNLAETKFTFPLPEMIFGNNSIQIMNQRLGLAIEFNTIDALEGLEETCHFKVSYHEEWLKSRRSDPELATQPSKTSSSSPTAAPSASSGKDLTHLTGLESLKPYDWTYSTNYRGTVRHLDPEYFQPSPDAKIPIERLMKPDPILFFDEMVLFEDELGDNGISMLTVKIRVMPTCLLLLSRFFMRIDNVAFRVRDTRIFIDLETSDIIREYKEQECQYDEVLKKVTGGSSHTSDPKGLLRDTNWVSQNIPILKSYTETNKKAEHSE